MQSSASAPGIASLGRSARDEASKALGQLLSFPAYDALSTGKHSPLSNELPGVSSGVVDRVFYGSGSVDQTCWDEFRVSVVCHTCDVCSDGGLR